MSFPRNNSALQSVNAGIDSDDFPTSWGSFEVTAELILSLPLCCIAATFDILAVYRLTPIWPNQQNALCVSWDGLVYVDRAVMFGLSSSAGVFGCVADMLLDIYKEAKFGFMVKWVDDFLAIRPPGQVWSEQDFMELTRSFGVPWSLPKLRPFVSVQHYIGFDWDLDSRVVSLPIEKIGKLKALVSSWLVKGSKFTEHDAASLHGKLVHSSCVFPLLKPFIRSAALFASDFHSSRASLNPPSSLQADLSWVLFLLQNLLNSRPLRSPHPVDLQWWGNASTSFGIGIAIGRFWAVWRWAPGFEVGPKRTFDIGWAEAVAIELGLRLALNLGLIVSARDRGKSFLVRSDNSGVVYVTNSGRSHSRKTNKILKHVYLLQAKNTIRLSTTYVSTRVNISDALSRGDVAAFLRGFPSVDTEASTPLPVHLSDKLLLWSSQPEQTP